MASTLNYRGFHWDEIKHYYYPTGLSEKLNEERILRKLQIQSVSSSLSNTKPEQNNSKNNPMMEKAFLSILPTIIDNPSKLEELVKITEKFKK